VPVRARPLSHPVCVCVCVCVLVSVCDSGGGGGEVRQVLVLVLAWTLGFALFYPIFFSISPVYS
jgi:hypothetical protein